MKSLIFLSSGSGGNMKFIFHAIKLLRLELRIQMVISDRNCPASRWAGINGIPNETVTYTKNQPQQLDGILAAVEPAVVITNIHKILSTSTICLNHEFINLHYSLLPAFKGLLGMEPVAAARRLNCPFVGATTHAVTAEVDSGDVLQQGLFSADWSSDMATIHDTVFKIGNLILLNTLLKAKNTRREHSLRLGDQLVHFSETFSFDWNRISEANIWKEIANDSI